jgi:ArsR family transcriptional regulator, arsenate/arsenite/antimonite-responsive transcriptional repressor
MVKVLCFATLPQVLILKGLRCTKIVQVRVTAGFFPIHVGRQELNTHKKKRQPSRRFLGPQTILPAMIVTEWLGRVKGEKKVDRYPYFRKYGNMAIGTTTKRAERVAKYADMFSAMGTEPRLRIMQLLLSAHPEGLVVGDIQGELEIPNSTLSHHLDKLKNEDLVRVQRESTFLRYTANTDALQELLQFLYSECCTRNKALKPQDIVEVCG